MNWVRYNNKKEMTIRKKEEEWFAKKQYERVNDEHNNITASRGKSGNHVSSNLDLQRILNLTDTYKSNKKSRVIINKVNLDNAGKSLFQSFDMDGIISKSSTAHSRRCIKTLDNHVITNKPMRNVTKNCIAKTETLETGGLLKNYTTCYSANLYNHRMNYGKHESVFLKPKDLGIGASSKKVSGAELKHGHRNIDSTSLLGWKDEFYNIGGSDDRMFKIKETKCLQEEPRSYTEKSDSTFSDFTKNNHVVTFSKSPAKRKYVDNYEHEIGVKSKNFSCASFIDPSKDYVPFKSPTVSFQSSAPLPFITEENSSSSIQSTNLHEKELSISLSRHNSLSPVSSPCESEDVLSVCSPSIRNSLELTTNCDMFYYSEHAESSSFIQSSCKLEEFEQTIRNDNAKGCSPEANAYDKKLDCETYIPGEYNDSFEKQSSNSVINSKDINATCNIFNLPAIPSAEPVKEDTIKDELDTTNKPILDDNNDHGSCSSNNMPISTPTNFEGFSLCEMIDAGNQTSLNVGNQTSLDAGNQTSLDAGNQTSLVVVEVGCQTSQSTTDIGLQTLINYKKSLDASTSPLFTSNAISSFQDCNETTLGRFSESYNSNSCGNHVSLLKEQSSFIDAWNVTVNTIQRQSDSLPKDQEQLFLLDSISSFKPEVNKDVGKIQTVPGCVEKLQCVDAGDPFILIDSQSSSLYESTLCEDM